MMRRDACARREQRASNGSASASAFEGQALPPGHEALIVAGATGARERGTVWIERRSAAWSEGLRLRAAARDSLFLGRSRCRGGGAQNNDSGKRTDRPDRHVRLLVRLRVILA